MSPVFYIVLIIGMMTLFIILLIKQIKHTRARKAATGSMRSGEHDFAIKNLKKIVQEDPNDHQALFSLTKLLLRGQKNGEALQSAKKLLERNLQGSGVTQIDAVLILAEAEEVNGNPDNAYRNILIAKGLDATNPEVNLRLTLYEYERGNFQEAFSYAGILLRINPTHAKAQLYRGLAAYRLGNTETAIEDLRRAIQLDATNYEAALYLTRIYSKFSNLQECVNFGGLAERLAKTGEQKAEAMLSVGGAYTRTGDPARGEAKLTAALQETIEPELSKTILQELITLSEREKNIHKTVKFLKQYLNLDPNHPGVLQKFDYYKELQGNSNLEQFEMLPMSKFPDFCKELCRNIIHVDHIQAVDINQDGSVDILASKTNKKEYTIYQFRFIRGNPILEKCLSGIFTQRCVRTAGKKRLSFPTAAIPKEQKTSVTPGLSL